MSLAGRMSANSLSKAMTSSSSKELVRSFWGYAILKDSAALAFILILALVYFKNALVDGQIYVEPDTTTFYYPVMSLVVGALKQFAIPLWTPYIFGGFPLFADGEAGMLYPPNLLLMWLLPMQQALVWGRIVRFFLAGSFMYAYLRSLSASRLSSLLASVVFAFGSFMVTQLHHTNVGDSAIWLPLILFFVELAFRADGPRRVIFLLLAGVSLGIQNLGIHIQPVLLTLLTFSLYVPFRTLLTGNASVGLGARLRLLSVTLLIVPAVGFGVAAVQLLPLYELGTFSFRGGGTSYWFATSYSLPLQNIITLVLPYFFERPDGSSWSLWVEWESTVYVGIIPLALAALAATQIKRRMTLFYVFLAMLSLLLAFGDYSPVNLYWLIWQVPGFSSLRVPARFSYLFVFSSAVLAAIGLEWLTRSVSASRALELGVNVRRRRWFLRLVGAIVSSCGALLAGVLWLRSLIVNDRDAVVRFLQENYVTMRNHNTGLSAEGIYDALKATLDLTNSATLQPIVLLSAFALLLLLWHRFSSRATIWRSLLVVIVAADLMAFALRFHPTASWDAIAAPSGPARFLMQQNGMHRVYNRYGGIRSEPNRLLPFKVAAVGGYSSLEVERHRKFMQAIENGNTKLLDLWNVRFVVAKAGQRPLSSSYPVVYQEGDVVILENKSYLPRAFVVDSFVVVDSGAAALEKLSSGDFDPTSAVVLEEEPLEVRREQNLDAYSVASTRRGPANARVATGSTKGISEIDAYKREEVSVYADVSKGSFLVLADSFYPGWRAYIDGKEAKIYRADYLFRSVFVPPGSHTVEFVFRPLGFELGRNITIATILTVFSICIYLMASKLRKTVGSSSQESVANFVPEPMVD